MFYFAKRKGDQSWDKSGDPWHVYSNPKNPELCPVLALEKVSSFTSRPSEWKFSSFARKQTIQPLHTNISQDHIWQQGNVSYSWCGGALVRVPFVLEGRNSSVLVWIHGQPPYGVYMIEGLLDHGPSKGSVHLLRKGQWSIHRPISDSYIIFDERICDFSASLGLHRFNRKRDGRESWSNPE